MSKKPLLLGAVASIIAINSVVADTTVTSKTYVDTTRQATIPEAGVNAEENGGGVSVVTYTDTAGQIGERGIYSWGREDTYEGQEQSLVTADAVNEAFAGYGLCIERDENENCLLIRIKEPSDGNYLPVYTR